MDPSKVEPQAEENKIVEKSGEEAIGDSSIPDTAREPGLETNAEMKKTSGGEVMSAVASEEAFVKAKAGNEIENLKAQPSEAAKICQATKKNGEPCNMKALSDGCCFAHSPALAEKRKEASKRGGAHSAKVERIKKLLPSRFAPVSAMLEDVLEGLKSNKMDARTALAIANVSRVLVAVMNTGELEERLSLIEGKERNQNVAEKPNREFGERPYL